MCFTYMSTTLSLTYSRSVLTDSLPHPATVLIMTPRYEYRVWAADLTELEIRLVERCEPLGVRASQEIYLVFRRPDLNVKIRSGVLDIKQLVGMEQGFQLWTPTLKEAFPLPLSAAAEILADLAQSDPLCGGDEPVVLDRFLALAEEVGVVAVTVAKTRHGYWHDGCILEFAEVVIDGSSLHTVAVESDDLDAAVDLATQLGVDDLPNQSYQTAIRHALRV